MRFEIQLAAWLVGRFGDPHLAFTGDDPVDGGAEGFMDLPDVGDGYRPIHVVLTGRIVVDVVAGGALVQGEVVFTKRLEPERLADLLESSRDRIGRFDPQTPGSHPLHPLTMESVHKWIITHKY